MSNSKPPRKKASPDQIQQIAILRQAGWTVAAISERTGLSTATINRVAKRHKVKPGSAEDELVQAARAGLIEAFSDNQELLSLYASLTLDTIGHIKLARQRAAEALERLQATDVDQAALVMRAIAAHATAIKVGSDTLRSLLPRPEDESRLPELIIRSLTKEDVERLRREQRLESQELGIGDIEEEHVKVESTKRY